MHSKRHKILSSRNQFSNKKKRFYEDFSDQYKVKDQRTMQKDYFTFHYQRIQQLPHKYLLFQEQTFYELQQIQIHSNKIRSEMFNYFFIPSYLNPTLPLECDRAGISTSEQEESTSQPEKIQKIQRKYDCLKKKFDQLLKQNESLRIEIEELQANQPQPKKKKIKRRSEQELTKDFKCPYHGCLKEYASDLALNLHMKMKHNAGTKKHRMAIVKQIIEAHQNGQQTPQISIDLPPNYLQEYNKNLQQSKKADDINFQ